jgi:hypothetical protein
MIAWTFRYERGIGLILKVKKIRRAKSLCSWFDEIDSFDMFKYKEGLESVRNSEDRLCFEIFQYNVKARLMDDYSLSVSCDDGSYVILVEKRSCNYGGYYHFFHCPTCNMRMRKLYCIKGVYLCRKCAKLGYYTQRLNRPERLLHMGRKIEKHLNERAGALDSKPPWMKQHTFQKLRKRYVDYDEKRFYDSRKAHIDLFGQMRHREISDYYCLYVPSDFLDVYDCKESTDC